MTVAATITLDDGVTEITLQSPRPEYTLRQQRAQSIIRTASGNITVYDKQATHYIHQFDVILTEAQRDDLDDFFHDDIQGALNTFDYTDHFNVTHSDCRLLNDGLEFRKTRFGRWIVTLELEVPGTVQ